MQISLRQGSSLVVALACLVGCTPRDPNDGNSNNDGSSGTSGSTSAANSGGSGGSSVGTNGGTSGGSGGSSVGTSGGLGGSSVGTSGGSGASGTASSGAGTDDCDPVDPMMTSPHPGGFLSVDETWDPSGGPIVLANELTVSPGVTLTIMPCTEVRIAASRYFYVNGTLIARGADPRHPVRFTSSQPGQRFRSIVITAPGRAELAYADISGGGDQPGQTGGASIEVVGDTLPIARPLKVSHVTVRDSAGYGIVLRNWAGFTEDSQDLTVTNNGHDDVDHQFAVRMDLNAVHTLPSGSYTGNAHDAIQVLASSPHYKVEGSETFRARGVPYQVGGGGAFGVIEVDGGNTLATLTIEPGVEIRFFSGTTNVGGLFIGNSGTMSPTGELIALGTAAAPIVLTGVGANPPAGTWEGVTFEGPISAGTQMQAVRIVAAGAHGGDQGFGCPPLPQPMGVGTDAALKLFHPPSSQFFTSSEIINSSTYGIFHAYDGTLVDFLPGNTFTGVALCRQVLPKDPNGGCPMDPACP